MSPTNDSLDDDPGLEEPTIDILLKDDSVAQTALTTSDSPQDESSWKRNDQVNEFDVALKSGETTSSLRDEPNVDIHVITDTILAGTRKRPRALVHYLNEMYQEGPRLFVDLSDEPPSDSVLKTLEYQLIHLPWSNAHSPVPSIAKALEFCYILSAWECQCIVLCENGKRKTAPMIAAMLKFSNKTNRCYEGFCHFLERRCSIPKPDEIRLPASLSTFFENFDTAVNLGTVLNSRPLLLEAIALQGVPVEDRPCIDVWDTTGHVYTSSSSENHWADEEGFYSLQIKVHGDFCLICRFGGAYASDADDASKVLFQYCNTTAFMEASGPYELPATHVDLSQRYASQLVENFLLTVIFDEDACDTDSEDIEPSVLEGLVAKEAGWQLIASRHPLTPSDADIDRVLGEAMGELDSCPRHIIALALQLANFDSTMALTFLLEGWLRNWWQQDISAPESNQITTQQEATILDPYLELSKPEAQERLKAILANLGTLHNDASFDTEDSDATRTPLNVTHPGPLMKPLPGDVATTKITSFRLSSILNESSLLLDEQPVAPLFSKHGRSHTPGILEDVENDHAVEILNAIDHVGVTLSDVLECSEKCQRVADYDDTLQAESQRYLPYAPHTAEDRSNPLESLAGTGVDQDETCSKEQQRDRLESENLDPSNGRQVQDTVLPPTESASSFERGPPVDSACVPDKEAEPPTSTPKEGIRSTEAADARLVPKQRDGDGSLATTVTSEEAKEDYTIKAHAGDFAGAIQRDGHPLSTSAQGIAGLAAAAALKKQRNEDSPLVEIAGSVSPSEEENQSRGGIAALAAAAALKNRSNSSGSPVAGIAGLAAAAALKKRSSGVAAPANGIAGLAAATALKKQANGLVSPANGIAGLAAAAALKKQSSVVTAPENGIAGLAAAAALKKCSKSIPSVEGVSDLAAAAASTAVPIKGQHASNGVSLESSQSPDSTVGCPLKEDPKYQKYYKMLKMGLPRGAVENAMQRDQVACFVLDLDPERSLASQTLTEQSSQSEDPALKDDPKYTKYFKMLKMGLPRGAVQNAMRRDEVDEEILDLDPEKSLKSQRSENDDGLPLRDDPAFQKYFKMFKMGLPDGAVRNAMQRDGVDPSILDLDHSRSLKSQMKSSTEEDDGVAIKDDPAFAKYFKMMKMGLPDGAVRNAMQRDDVDPSILDLDHNLSLKSQRNDDEKEDDGVPIKDDPAFSKYFKMMKMGLPMGAVRNAMERDGVDSSVLDLDHEKSLQSQQAKEPEDDGVPLKDDPEWSKYFKMLKMGLPMGAVKNAVERDGKDAAILDLDHSKSIISQTRKAAKRGIPAKKKKRVRRKKIFWNPLDSRQIKEDSIWSRVKGAFQMDKLSYDEKEFAALFTESTDPGDKKSKSKAKDTTKPKKSVQVIDGKRSMNGGIILARLKMDYSKIADMVDQMYVLNLPHL